MSNVEYDRALERGAEGTFTTADVQAILLKQQRRCYWCKIEFVGTRWNRYQLKGRSLRGVVRILTRRLHQRDLVPRKTGAAFILHDVGLGKNDENPPGGEPSGF